MKAESGPPPVTDLTEVIVWTMAAFEIVIMFVVSAYSAIGVANLIRAMLGDGADNRGWAVGVELATFGAATIIWRAYIAGFLVNRFLPPKPNVRELSRQILEQSRARSAAESSIHPRGEGSD